MALDLDELAGELREFARARGWEPLHTPKNLAAALVVEAGELLEQFQWLSSEESKQHASSSAVADEIADVLIYLVRLADIAGVDIAGAVQQKMVKNAAKHPPTW